MLTEAQIYFRRLEYEENMKITFFFGYSYFFRKKFQLLYFGYIGHKNILGNGKGDKLTRE